MRGCDFKLADGRVLRWYEAGQGRPLVLLHGWSMSAAAFSELSELLSADFRLLIPDLPGHGASSPAEDYSLTALAKDLALWLGAVAAAPVVLFGWSLGGMLAMELARDHEFVSRLILAGSNPRFTSSEEWPSGLPKTQLKALSRNLERSFEKTLVDFFRLAFADEEISPERLRAIGDFSLRNCALPDRKSAGSLLTVLVEHDQRALLHTLSQPTLVIHGALDRITPVLAAQRMAEIFPDCSLKIFEGVGHAPFLSRPEEVARMVKEFCQ